MTEFITTLLTSAGVFVMLLCMLASAIIFVMLVWCASANILSGRTPLHGIPDILRTIASIRMTVSTLKATTRSISKNTLANAEIRLPTLLKLANSLPQHMRLDYVQMMQTSDDYVKTFERLTRRYCLISGTNTIHASVVNALTLAQKSRTTDIQSVESMVTTLRTYSDVDFAIPVVGYMVSLELREALRLAEDTLTKLKATK